MKPKKAILAIDQGSSATKALLLDEGGRVLQRFRSAISKLTQKSVLGSVDKILREVNPAVIGIANQRSTLCFLERNELIPWWEQNGVLAADPKIFRAATGLPALPNWWAGKVARFARPGERVGTVDTLLIGRYLTDFSNAARTGLLDIYKRRRTRELLEMFGVNNPLPEICPSLFDYTPKIKAVLGDAGASLMGMTGGARGIMTVTLGTGGFLHMPCAAATIPPDGLYLAPAWQAEGRICWTLEAAIPAMAKALSYVDHNPRATPRDSKLRIFLAPEGLGALSKKRGIQKFGDWEGASAGERLGAIYTGLASLVAMAVEKFPERPRLIVTGGGLSRIEYLTNKISELTGIPVTRVAESETTAYGAAMLAARAIGVRLPSLLSGGVRS